MLLLSLLSSVPFCCVYHWIYFNLMCELVGITMFCACEWIPHTYTPVISLMTCTFHLFCSTRNIRYLNFKNILLLRIDSWSFKGIEKFQELRRFECPRRSIIYYILPREFLFLKISLFWKKKTKTYILCICIVEVQTVLPKIPVSIAFDLYIIDLSKR